MEGLLKNNIVTYENRPIWFDIYKKFPPKSEPIYRTYAANDINDAPTPQKLLYYEDQIRA
jgi:hypothetical protein